MTSPLRPVKSSTYPEAVKHRRSISGVTDKISVSDDRIVEIVNDVIQICPSSWNMQSTRIFVTLGNEHKKFWDTVISAAKPSFLKSQGEEAWKRNEQRFKYFRDAYGTNPFVFTKLAVSGRFLSSKTTHPSRSCMNGSLTSPFTVFETFAEHSNAMHQITLWIALELEDLGASLQHSHFVPGVEFGILSSWSVKAEIVFGAHSGKRPTAPEKVPVSNTVKVYKWGMWLSRGGGVSIASVVT
ncbi:hypothetical protein N7492_002083 [Penicillium capsulatum]|uniref:Nitroreductase domain-containing protein n=1 Tax=Penicillium capsulatum TaxID=69766 RepID=A0A9W9IGW7_9EURO|nr:hypothetical protein N7492_002083 [Penicillium capsulatum]